MEGTMRRWIVLAAVAAATLVATAWAAPAAPAAVAQDPGCATNALDRNDDGSTGAVAIGFPVNFFGTTYTHLFINNNGNVTFDSAMSTFTPFGLSGPIGTRIIAPFFADVDTRGAGSDVVRYSWGATTLFGRPAFCVNWLNVGYYSAHFDKLNSFQLILVDRSDVGAGDFDIYFNYDQIQWETGDASGGVGGFGGTSAAVGFSAGTGAPNTFFEFPASRVNGALLDSNTLTGLIHGSRNTLVLGRYVFHVRNGVAPIGGRISGSLRDGAGNSLADAPVQICPSAGGACAFVTRTNVAGDYDAPGLPPGSYFVRAFPPSGSSLSPATSAPVEVTAGSLADVDLTLRGPAPPPPGTSIDNDTPLGGIPSVVVGRPVHLETSGCDGGTATYTVAGQYGGSISGAMTEGPQGTYTADFTIPFTGPATVAIVIEGCPTVEFNIYIDPSGFVRTPGGSPIAGATVTLLRSDSPAGQFVQVPNGSDIMSPANRTNPDLTDATGHFGWDTIAGFYKVRAEKEGCHAPGNPSQTAVETAVVEVPPPVTDLLLTLECAETDSEPPTLSLPAEITAEATSATGAAVAYTATATDAVDPSPTVTCSPASGSMFAFGTTAVDCTATDASGNSSNGSFNVTVTDTTAPAVVAALALLRADDDGGLYRVTWTCTDAVGVTSQSARLNGIRVVNQQRVALELDDEFEVDRDDGRLSIEAPSFLLVVTCSDAAGNNGSGTAQPAFPDRDDDDDEDDEDDD
jgi:nidogen-like/HYR domain-containing protein/carboxypeptidase family protein